MARALLLVLLPIVVPLLLYAGYIKFIKRPAPAGDTGEAEARERSRQKIVFWIVLGLFVVVATAFGALRFSGTEAPPLIDGRTAPSRPAE